MARPKRATVGSKYVAEAALTDLLEKIAGSEASEHLANGESRPVAEYIVQEAWDVEHFPVAGKVQITLDLAPLDKPADAPQ